MSLIKDIYSLPFYTRFAATLNLVIPSLNQKKFIGRMMDDGFEEMEWKERMKHTTRVFHEFLPAQFSEAAVLISEIITQLRKAHTQEDSLVYIFFADYVETYGIDDFENAVKAIELITQFVSCEFSVRPFIVKYGDRMMAQMVLWSLHENYKVRRLSTEGSRPRLPWAMALPALKKDPAAALPILENLKNDPSEWVRKSVANHINDIAKDHPSLVIGLAAKWKGLSKETDAIIKHGCRTLLKQGHAEILKHYQLESKNLSVSGFEILTPEVKTGEHVEFCFSVHNLSDEAQTVRLEYGLYYRKANGMLSKKVFKISEKSYPAAAVIKVHRKQSFRIITTRTFYTGEHQLSIIINGEEKELKSFNFSLLS